MGRLINGPNGPFIGKAGSFIGYTVNGVGYIKGLYKPRTKAPTEKEALNRQKFAAAQFWLQPIVTAVRIGFKGHSQRSQGFVAAKSWLMRNALQVVDGQIVIDPARVKISSGTLPLPEDIKCSVHEPFVLRVSWKPSSLSGYELDQSMILLYDPETGQVDGDIYGSTISSGGQLVNISKDGSHTFHVYLAFIAGDRSRQSDSVYLGKIDVSGKTVL